jgi:ribosomal-protein-serine acetyltransferase
MLNDCTIDAGLRLRPLSPADAPALFAALDASRDHLRPWMTWLEETRSVDDSRGAIDRITASREARNGDVCAILADGRLVGTIGLHGVDWTHRRAELGYWLAADVTGRGLMTRSCRAVLEMAFGELGLNRLEIRAAAENHPSRAVAERLGFKLEGLLREAGWVYGRPVDCAVYGLLAREWQGL